MMNRRLKKFFRVLENTVLKDKKYRYCLRCVQWQQFIYIIKMIKDTDFVRVRINRQSGSESNYAVFE